MYATAVLANSSTAGPCGCWADRTGTGKTDLLLEWSRRGVGVVDLEAWAINVRGSSFGGLGPAAQPSTDTSKSPWPPGRWPRG